MTIRTLAHRLVRALLPVGGFDLDAPCPVPNISYGSPLPRPTCERDLGHKGKHWCVYEISNQTGTWEVIDVWTWGGGVVQSLKWGFYLCDECGTPVENGTDCLHCRSWDAVLVEHAADTKECIVVDGHLYRWTRATGAFGNASVIVRMHNGKTYGPSSQLWSRAEVPCEYRDRITDNATLEWVRP